WRNAGRPGEGGRTAGPGDPLQHRTPRPGHGQRLARPEDAGAVETANRLVRPATGQAGRGADGGVPRGRRRAETAGRDVRHAAEEVTANEGPDWLCVAHGPVVLHAGLFSSLPGKRSL